MADNTTATTTSSFIPLTRGQFYDVTLEYYQNAGSKSIDLQYFILGIGNSGTIPQNALYPDSVPIIVEAQTESLTVTAPSGATANGNLIVKVKGVFYSSTGETVTVPLQQATHTTATKIAGAIAAAINANANVGSKFTASNSGAIVIMTTKPEYITSNDAYLNVAISSNSLGVTVATTSTDGVAGSLFPQNKEQGTPTSFTVLASGHNLSYQWRKNGVFIPGANSKTYTIPCLAPSDAANYSVFVSNSYGFAVSNEAQLTVPTTFTDTDNDGIQDGWEAFYFGTNTAANASQDSDGDGITNLNEYLAGTSPIDPNSKFAVTATKSVSPPGCTLTFTAQANKYYSLQYKESLSDASWITFQTYPASSSQRTISYTDATTGYNSRFYRVSTP